MPMEDDELKRLILSAFQIEENGNGSYNVIAKDGIYNVSKISDVKSQIENVAEQKKINFDKIPNFKPSNNKGFIGDDDKNPNFDNRISGHGHKGMFPDNKVFNESSENDENPLIMEDVKFPGKKANKFPEPDPDHFNPPGNF